jgi:hypothetical protein
VEAITSRKSSRHLLAARQRHLEALHQRVRAVVTENYPGFRGRGDGCRLEIRRGDRIEKRLRCGPNEVHAAIFRNDGSWEDLGVNHNLLTNIGRDWWSSQWGFIPTGITTASPSTAVSSSSITTTATPLTASNLASPQLGVAGLRVYAAPHTTTNPVTYGNIVSNTTSVITIDKWWTAADGTGTTPTSGDGFIIAPGGMAALRFVALSTNASAASASDLTLANEVTSNGGARVLALYAHTFGTSSLTLSNTFSIAGTITAIHKAGLFAALTSGGADLMGYETVLNADATVVSGDSLALTWTVNPSG